MNKLGITFKLTLVFILFAGTLMVGLSVPAYLSARAALRTAAISERLSSAIEKQDALNAWVAERRHAVEDIANQEPLQEAVQVYLSAPPDSTASNQAHDLIQANLLTWSGTGHRFPSFQVLAATSGRILIATTDSDEGKYRENELYFLQGLQAGYVQNPLYDLALGRPSMVAAVPLTAPGNGPVIAVLAGQLNMDEMSAIIQRRTGLLQTDDAFLVNTSHLLVTQPHLIPDPAVLQRGTHSQAVDLCLARNSGVIEAPDYRNVPAIIVYRWLPERQLCLISKMDQQEAYAPSKSLGTSMLMIGGVVLLLGSIAAVRLSRTVARPILQLVDSAEQIGQGNLDARIEVKSKDEIGLLGRAFNGMAASIAEKEARLRSLAAELEQRVQARTAELGASEERYRLLAETSPDMIFVIDREDRVQYVNERAARQFGKTAGQVVGKARAELFPPEIAESQALGLQQVLKSGQPLSAESQIAFPDGERWLDTQLVPIRNEDGKVSAVMGVSRDVTERKQSEEKVIASEVRYRRLFEAAKDGILILDSETGMIEDANPFLIEMLGFSLEEFQGKKIWDLGYFKDIVASQENFLELQKKDSIRYEDLPLETLDGRRLDVEFIGNIFQVDHHRVFQCTIRDITYRKQAEEKLGKLLDDLSRSNAELERFAYVASHDLQEPLRMVTSYLQLLERRYKDKLDSDALEFINYAVDGSSRMKTLISDLLAYSRVGTHGKDFALTDCEAVLGRALTNLQVLIQESRAKVTHDPLPKVIADAVQLESLFQNLIDNAVKFRGKKTPKIHIGVEQQGAEWVFSVSDNGIGIDPQYFERIFIIFQRLHNREEYSGTGIGLAISKLIVERHGGRMWVESQSGKGSIFYFTLPAVRKQEVVKNELP